MPKNAHNKDWGVFLIPSLVIPLLALVVTFVLWLDNHSLSRLNPQTSVNADISNSITSLFSPYYPLNQEFKEELSLMRALKKLEAQNEILINKMVVSSSTHLEMPSGILWCLLFQESRLNHLVGLNESYGSRGIGQFSYFGFYEINHHLDRYKTKNLEMFKSVLGKDVRPVAPLKDNIHSTSSYFFIPTAITSTAAYLNNRYHQLQRNLERKNLDYDPAILWLYAAMAYNKGTRSVLSLWNEIHNRNGEELLIDILNKKTTFFETLSQPRWFKRALRRIWPRQKADRYVKELIIHMEKMKACSVVGATEKSQKTTGID